jgi:hypothetical protein
MSHADTFTTLLLLPDRGPPPQPAAAVAIEKEGLRMPGGKVKVANGQRFGAGIYCSPDIDFAARYSQVACFVQ